MRPPPRLALLPPCLIATRQEAANRAATHGIVLSAILRRHGLLATRRDHASLQQPPHRRWLPPSYLDAAPEPSRLQLRLRCVASRGPSRRSAIIPAIVRDKHSSSECGLLRIRKEMIETRESNSFHSINDPSKIHSHIYTVFSFTKIN